MEREVIYESEVGWMEYTSIKLECSVTEYRILPFGWILRCLGPSGSSLGDFAVYTGVNSPVEMSRVNISIRDGGPRTGMNASSPDGVNSTACEPVRSALRDLSAPSRSSTKENCWVFVPDRVCTSPEGPPAEYTCVCGLGIDIYDDMAAMSRFFTCRSGCVSQTERIESPHEVVYARDLSWPSAMYW